MDSQELQRLINAVSVFDKALGEYQKDGSGANKKLVIEKHKAASAIINSASSEIRGEIGESWSKVDLCMNGFAASSGGLTKVMTFGQSGKSANTQIDMIRGAVATTLKILKNMTNPVATATVQATPTVSSETSAEATKVYNAVSVFDKALGEYQKDGSGANKKLVIEKHKAASAIINSASSEIRGEIGESWSKVDLCMNGFAASSGGLTKVMTFGQSGKSANTQIDMIRGAVATTLKSLKTLGAGAIVKEETPIASAAIVEEAFEQEKAVIEEQAIIEEAVAEETIVEEIAIEEAPVEEQAIIEEAVAEEPIAEESTVEEVVEETVAEEAPVKQPITKKTTVKKVIVTKKPIQKASKKAPKKAKSGGGALPIIGFWLGFASFVLPFGAILAVVGLILSIVGIKRHSSMAIPGIIVNLLVILFTLLPLIISTVMFIISIIIPIVIFIGIAILRLFFSIVSSLLLA